MLERQAVNVKHDDGSDSSQGRYFINPCPKWERREQHFFTVSRLTIMTIPINPLIPMGIIAVDKDLGPTICENQENAKPGTETQIKFM